MIQWCQIYMKESIKATITLVTMDTKKTTIILYFKELINIEFL